ncbi:MAG TPA: hypothetical protein VMT34_15110, partial [Aggregatilineales bacterium]|nr:hypothetical protein [Aggregatilineales bacterium]
LGILAYLLVMAPWFIRNMNAIGTILPTGGFQTAWLRQYDEIFNYPPGVRFADFAASGIGSILSSRLRGITFGLENLVSVEGLVVLAPLMLLGLWRRRADPLLSGFILYAIGLHLAMALIFPLPGENGGLWHSSAALMPFWMALGVAGLDDVLAWAARRRRWRLQQAQTVFSSALMAWAIGFSLFIFNGQTAGANAAGGYFTGLTAYLPPDAVVMINDPSALYYYTGRSGIRLPTAVPDVIPDLARRFGVNYVVLDVPGTPAPLWDLFSGTNVPPFLTPVYRTSRVVIYKINS